MYSRKLKSISSGFLNIQDQLYLFGLWLKTTSARTKVKNYSDLKHLDLSVKKQNGGLVQQ